MILEQRISLTGRSPETGDLRCNIGFAPVLSTGKKIQRLDVSQICQKTAGTKRQNCHCNGCRVSTQNKGA